MDTSRVDGVKASLHNGTPRLDLACIVRRVVDLEIIERFGRVRRRVSASQSHLFGHDDRRVREESHDAGEILIRRVFIVRPMPLLEVEIEEPVTPVPSPEEARFRRLVSTISICFYFGAARAALLQERPFVPQMALAVAMITRIAVGRRVLPALVDGGHLLLLLSASAVPFGCVSLLAQRQPSRLDSVMSGYERDHGRAVTSVWCSEAEL